MGDGLIFICYRRDDAAGYARAIYDRFVQDFSKERVFIDVDAIEPGLPFDEAIEKAVGRCVVLLAVIDRNWLAPHGAGDARINDPKDYVRLEIAAALSRNIRVLPVLLDGAKMPSEEELPEPLRALSRRHAIEISNSSFKSDVERLISSVSGAMLRATTKPPSPKYLTLWVTLGVLGLGALFWIAYAQFGRSVDASSALVEESEPNDQAAQMNKISFPGKIRGLLENADDRDVFGFTTPSKMKASRIRIILRPLSSGYWQPNLAVYNKNWQLIVEDYTPYDGPVKITIASISNSSYFAVVKSRLGYRGAYELEVGAEDALP